jgi:hypothetical protein
MGSLFEGSVVFNPNDLSGLSVSAPAGSQWDTGIKTTSGGYTSLPSGFNTQPTGDGGGGSQAQSWADQQAAQAAAAQRAKSQSQIDAINRLLGYIGSQKDPGLQGIEAGYTENNRRLGEQKTRAMQAYTDQDVKNTRNRESGYGQVDKFVNQSANSLSRVFQGANAGNSSVARLLAPQLVGKAGGERRQGVTETANENAANIKQARKYADQDFTTAEADLLTQRDSQKRSFLDNITQQEADLLGKRQAYEQDAGLATDGTQNEINARFGTLQSLLGQYKPTYNTKTVTADPAKFSEYSVDPAKLQLNSNQPAETRYYGTNLKKKFGEV